MFRLWAKTIRSGRTVRDTVICDPSASRRTAKVVHAITAVCREFDLPEPIWLDANIRDFRSRAKTRFSQDSFIESVPFDYLEIQVIEEDSYT